ncbi:MAG: response regulator [Deltaproteobacteria bacterium]|jgi:signal transduction histidine kinase/ActR/RegA family two-component response regulator/HAMP domain-containing protein|nr:response regulator [Deltaproteobacteria bacterium]
MVNPPVQNPCASPKKGEGIWRFANRLGLRSKLIIIFLLVKVIPLILLASLAWRQFTIQGDALKNIAVRDSKAALNDSAIENIERMSTTAADRVAAFLYARDSDIRYAATIEPTEANYQSFVNEKRGRLIKPGVWRLDPEINAWDVENPPVDLPLGVSSNLENEDMNGFHPRTAEPYAYDVLPLYEEMAFIDLNGQEIVKVVNPETRKVNYPPDPTKKNVSDRQNTYVKAETYFEELKNLGPGEIYVSDVTGAYVRSNYIGLYTPENLAKASADRGYPIEFFPEKQAYSGRENPVGQRFEGIVRWATPVYDNKNQKIGYVTFALNHDHIMELVDHLTPMMERTVQISSAFEGNYAFIWDYKGRSVVHPRHHSIIGFDPTTGDPEIPWLESSIYDGWQASGVPKWFDYVADYPWFHEQSRKKKPAPALTKQGLVGLDCRYLNNAPQCVGWMDLTKEGGSGSFYILWSGLYKLNTAAAIPYYTGHYAPSAANGYSKRGFGFVAIGSGLDFFTLPAQETEKTLTNTVAEYLRSTFIQLTGTTLILIVLVVLIAIWMASILTKNITKLIEGINRFRDGQRHFRFNYPVHDEFGTLADSFDEMAEAIETSVKNPLTIINMNRQIIYMNAQGVEIYGLPANEVIGQLYDDVTIYPHGSKYCPITALIEGRDPDILYIEDKWGQNYIRGKASYFYNKEGEKAGFIIETLNVTEMVLKQVELEKAVAAANLANEHKGEFLAHMSHEIRTPMNAIIGLSAIVKDNLNQMNSDSQELQEIRDNVRQIESSSFHLLGLLNDILDLSKIEAGKIEIASEIVELPVLINTVTSIMKTRCRDKGIKFIHPEINFTPSAFLTDPLHLRQVLINLLGNAVKFTPEAGTIEFMVNRLERQDDKALIEFVVKDSGIGISNEAMQAIFQPFEQGSGKITKIYGGTGLGLTISRHIVRLFGGDIKVQSQVGQGSEFRFSLWLKETQSAPLETEATPTDPAGRFLGKKLLLVDDVDLNRKIAKAMLKVTGISVDEANDGLEALQKFGQSPENTYDIILMDVQMPNMDGYQASEAIRNLNRTDAKKVPIIALTANAFKDDIDKALKAGMNAHIAKPVKLEKIVETICKNMKMD